MKRNMISFLSVLMAAAMLVLSGCGSADSGKGETQVDFNEVWSEINALEPDWTDGYFMDLTEDPDMMENYYPGLKDMATKQLVIRVPMMSAVVSEFVLAEAEDAETAGKIAEVLNQRIEDQASGGAWYPESMESWEQAKVLSNGNYVALIACAGHQAEAEKIVSDRIA